ncbi:MAG: hypothetical protein FJ387_20655 [Verrucomicrobia bacterium]|nr:hypothetical protein [Verrucomicrobiota bacterium]
MAAWHGTCREHNRWLSRTSVGEAYPTSGRSSPPASLNTRWRASTEGELVLRECALAELVPVHATTELLQFLADWKLDEQTLASLPLASGERERLMQIELACRFYAQGWLSLEQGAGRAALDQYASGVSLAERGIPRQDGMTEALEDVAQARRQ